MRIRLYALALALGALTVSPAMAQLDTPHPAQLSPVSAPASGYTWTVDPIFTVGDSRRGYTPPGVLDGLGAYLKDANTVRVLSTHEFLATMGYPYTLRNGTVLEGGRISYFDINRTTRRVERAGLAYRRVRDRDYRTVKHAPQLNEGTDPTEGINLLCSAWFANAGEHGFVDNIFFAGEETTNGQLFALDVDSRVLYAVPMAGRAAFENVAPVNTGDPNTIALVIGDDRAAAPLYLYVGQKDARQTLGRPTDFLDRNGLRQGTLYVWVADSGDTTPEDWNGTGTSRQGTFVPVTQFDPSQRNAPGYDSRGFADMSTLDAQSAALGAFQFSRPEDVSTNPDNDRQVVYASTGRSSLFPSDSWGTTYIADFDFSGPAPTALLTVVYDGDDMGGGQFAGPDYGLRTPDNLIWAGDDMVYVQEDRSLAAFGLTSGAEASVWQLDPATGDVARIATVNRSAIPAGQTDTAPTDIGNWETSGIIDVTDLFDTAEGERLMLLNIQAHSVVGGAIDSLDLVQGGQMVFLSGMEIPSGASKAETPSADLAAVTEDDLEAWPNPTRDEATVRYSVAQAGEARVSVFDALGREVATLADGSVSAGRYETTLGGLPGGVYVVRLVTAMGRRSFQVTLAG